MTDMTEIKEEHFEINDDEVVAVYASWVLAKMIPRPECLDNLMSILRRKKPRIMIVIETEANSNSPFFGSASLGRCSSSRLTWIASKHA